jgi:pantoate--beta-alanine ligase
MLQTPIIRTHDQLRSKAKAWRGFGERVAIAGLMGQVDASGLRQVQVARGKADRVIASVLPVDVDDEPLDMENEDDVNDCLDLERQGADLLFLPGYSEVFPETVQTTLEAAALRNALASGFEQGYLERWCLAAVRQMIQSQANVLILSELDWQLIAILRQIARDLDLNAKIVAAAPVREDDGAPICWRVDELSDAARPLAGKLRDAALGAAARISDGATATDVVGAAGAELTGAGFEAVDFFHLCDSATLAPVSALEEGRHARIFACARVEDVMLYDNAPVS